jgi:hypothetical protein
MCVSAHPVADYVGIQQVFHAFNPGPGIFPATLREQESLCPL